MKKRVCSLMLMFCMMVGTMLSVGAAGTPSDWAAAEVKTAIAEGLTTDKVTKDYQKNITREEFCELVVILYQKLTGKTVAAKDNPFSDTDNTEILKAYALGIVNGVSQTEFAPNNTITRQEMCVMIVRAIKASEVYLPNLKNNTPFHDARDIAEWAYKEVQYMYSFEIMRGVGENYISPLGNTTCEQAVILILRTYDKFHIEVDAESKNIYEEEQKIIERIYAGTDEYMNEEGITPNENVQASYDLIKKNVEELLNEGELKEAQFDDDNKNVFVVTKFGRKSICAIADEESEESNAGGGGKQKILSVNNRGVTASLAFAAFSGKTVDQLGADMAEQTEYAYTHQPVGASQCTVSEIIEYISDKNTHVILWNGHGDYFRSLGSCLVLAEENSPKKDLIYSEIPVKKESEINDSCLTLLVTSYLKKNGIKAHYALSPEFFDNYLAERDGGIFITNACHSAEDNRLADVFLEKGFDTYIGATGKINSVYSDKLMRKFSEGLCEKESDGFTTITAEKAFEQAKLEVGSQDKEGDSFKLIGAPDFRLIECQTVQSSNIAEYDGVLYTTNRSVPGMVDIPVRPAKYDYICSIAFYKDKLYYACKEGGTSDYRSAIYSCNVDGSNHKLIYDSTYDATDFIISNNKLYPGNKRGYFDLKTNTYKDLSGVIPEKYEVIHHDKDYLYCSNMVSSKKVKDGRYTRYECKYDIYKINVVTGKSECIKKDVSDVYDCIVSSDGKVYYKDKNMCLYHVKNGESKLVHEFDRYSYIVAIIDDVIYYGYEDSSVYMSCLAYYDLESDSGAVLASHGQAGGGGFFNW